MRKKYLTTYALPNGTKYSSYILADTFESAQSIIEQRGLGEVLDSLPTDNLTSVYTPLHELFDKFIDKPPSHRGTRPINLLHFVCFLLNLGQLSKRYVVTDNTTLFNDIGLIHQLVHLLQLSIHDLGESILTIRQALIELTQSAPEMFLTEEEQSLWKENRYRYGTEQHR